MEEMKKCKICEQVKLTSDFRTIHGQRGEWKSSYCIPCDKEKSRLLAAISGDKARILGDINQNAKLMLARAKHRAKKCGMAFDLDIAWIEEKLLICKCEETGLNFKYGEPCNGQTKNPWLPSLDRSDSNKGYTKDNVKATVTIFNIAKNEWTREQLETLFAALLKKAY